MNKTTEPEKDRAIVLSRVFDAPRAIVFDAFTNPLRLPMWWGPKGFTCETKSMDLRVGGAWRFDMLGMGMVFPNRIRWRAIVPTSRIEITVDSDKDTDPEGFEATITFEDVGGQTRVTQRSVLRSVKQYEKVVAFGAIELGKTTLEKCAENIANVRVRGNNVFIVEPGQPVAVMERVFKAAPAQLWEALTKPEHMRNWYGPRGTTVSQCTIDLRIGGRWRCVTHSNGEEHAFSGELLEIVPGEKIVQTWRYEPWPDASSVETLELHATQDGKTRVVATTRFEKLEHAEAHLKSGMEEGAAETWDRLEEVAASLSG